MLRARHQGRRPSVSETSSGLAATTTAYDLYKEGNRLVIVALDWAKDS